MERSITLNQAVLILPLLIGAFLIGLVLTSRSLIITDTMSNAITLDFCITIPLLYYLGIRKTEIPRYTVLSVFALCLVLASYVLPFDRQNLLTQIKIFALPALGVSGILISPYQILFSHQGDEK